MFFRKLFFALIITCSLPAFCCLNVYHTIDEKGEFHVMGDLGFIGFNKNFNLPKISKKLPDLEAQIQAEKSPYLLSDYAVLLMKAGKVEESLRLLITLNKKLPNEYKIAANLGTAYELNGDLDSALFYIERGMELNPNAHEGSEWVHVCILKTKMQLEKNPNLLSERSVLELSIEDLEKDEIREQLEIQIRERFPFSPGPNAIMASLMIDLGDCYAKTFSYEYAKSFYTLAQEYYGADEESTALKIKEMLDLRRKHSHKKAPQITNEGEDIMVGGVRYKDIIDDNNKNNFEIDWSKINTDVTALLALVDFEEIIPIEKEIMDSTETGSTNEGETEEPLVSDEKTNYLIPAIVGFVVVLLVIIGIRRRKKD